MGNSNSAISLTTEERTRLEKVEGIVFDIQRYSVHDGPGLRTNVFLKGCPLRCSWCANPESQAMQPELALFEQNCMTCGQFETPCPVCWRPSRVRRKYPLFETARFPMLLLLTLSAGSSVPLCAG